jgi:hypothetical protein
MNGVRRPAPRTLRGRLSLVALLTAAPLMLVLTVAFDSVAQRRLQHQADDELRTRAAAVATTVDTRGTTVRVLETSNDALLDADVWIYAGRQLLEQPPAAGRLTRVADALAGGAGTGASPPRSDVPYGSAPNRYPERGAGPPSSPRWTSPRTGVRPTPCSWDRSPWTPSCSPAPTP